MKAQIHKNSCLECNQTITNPICPECLATRVKNWLDDMGKTGTAKKITAHNVNGPTKCIFCGQGMSICAHCYSKDIYDFLFDKDPKLAREFLSRFDFELREEVLSY